MFLFSSPQSNHSLRYFINQEALALKHHIIFQENYSIQRCFHQNSAPSLLLALCWRFQSRPCHFIK